MTSERKGQHGQESLSQWVAITVVAPALLLALAAVGLFSTVAAGAELPGADVRHVCRTEEFSIAFPAGWAVEEPGNGPAVRALRPAEKGETGNRENVNVEVVDASPGADIDALLKVAAEANAKMARGFRKLQSGKMTIAGADARYLVFTVPVRVGQRTQTAKMAQYLVLSRIHAYVITCTASPSTYETYKPVFDRIAASLKFEDIPLRQARRGFKTKLARNESAKKPVAQPPSNLLSVVSYDGPAGRLAAYLSLIPKDGKKHPAIVWMIGGDCNTIDATAWKDASESNDQSARAYREAGIVMMIPSLRGGNENPGPKEGFLGEVDDVLAAADYLARQEGVDPERIYLGGHSTGGTMALLTAECSDRFRAVFSLSPIDKVAGYGPDMWPIDLLNRRESVLRSPRYWLASIHTPVFVFEGTSEPSNIACLRVMSAVSTNKLVHFYGVKGANHLSVVAPTNRLIASKMLKDTGATCNIQFTQDELDKRLGH
jgi:acetyl esterase/lipase